MVNQKFVDWISNVKKKGYSYDQIRTYLLHHDFKLEDIDEGITLCNNQSKVSFNKFLSQKGIVFRGFFYMFLGLFVLQIVSSLIQEVIFTLIISIIFGGIIIYYIFKRDLNKILMILFLLPPFGLFSLLNFTFIQSFASISNTIFYIIISAYGLIIGLISAHLFDMINNNSKDFLKKGLFFSIFMGIIFGINSFIGTTISKLNEQMSQISSTGSSGAGGIVSMIGIVGQNVFNVNIGFVLTFILFNIPYLYVYFKKENPNPKMLLWYLLPAVLFLIISFGLKIIAGNIMVST